MAAPGLSGWLCSHGAHFWALHLEMAKGPILAPKGMEMSPIIASLCIFHRTIVGTHFTLSRSKLNCLAASLHKLLDINEENKHSQQRILLGANARIRHQRISMGWLSLRQQAW